MSWHFFSEADEFFAGSMGSPCPARVMNTCGNLPPDNHWQCTWQTGPDAGATFLVGPGRHLVGRAHTADIRCDDLLLQPHHALLEIGIDGELALTQLTGRAPLLVDGVAATDTMHLADTATIEVGASALELLRWRPHAGVPHPDVAHIVDGTVVRQPRALPEWQPTDHVAPPQPPRSNESAAGLVPALLGVVGAGAIAVVVRQPMFLVFGALGGVVAIGSWAAQRLASRRRSRRELQEFTAAHAGYRSAVLSDRERFRSFHLATVPTIAQAHRALATPSATLWARRAAHPDAFVVALGCGDIAWPDSASELGVVEDREAHDLPIPTDLGPGARLALRGPSARALARSLLLQLATSVGPADLRVVVVTDKPAHWDCVRGLPHISQPDGTVAVISEAKLTALLADLGEHSAHLLFVTDQPTLLSTRTSPLRRALTDSDRHALMVLLNNEVGVPQLCTSVFTSAHGPIGRWVPDTRATMLPVPVRLAGISERGAFTCAARMKSLIDPEDPLSAGSGLPRDLSLSSLLASESGTTLTAAGIVATWVAAGADPSPRTLIGMAADGAVDIDLVRDGPHGLIAGTTGAGKSELLRSLVAGMAAGASPSHLSFVLVDYKGGATFDACATLPHVVGVITDLDDQLANRALRSLHAELRRRETILRDHGAGDLANLRSIAPQVMLPRLVVVIDEFAALVAEQPDFLHALVGVAQRGRSLGVHLILATQRPNGVINDEIRANTNLRLALRLQDTADATDVVGVPSPALLPRGLPGRAVMRLGADDHLTFQTARCTGAASSNESELQVLVEAICEAARLAGTPQPPSPWQPALPLSLSLSLSMSLAAAELAPGAIGLIDDPDHQRLVPLRWSADDGHLLIAASPGAGATTTLTTLATIASAPVYVIDGRGSDVLTTVADHPQCVAVVRLHERERLMRLLHRLRGMVRTRLAGGASDDVLLVIDGLDAVRRSLDDLDTTAEFDALEEVLADGEAGGITIVASVEHAAAVPTALLARCPHRWVMHLHDPLDAAMLGVRAAQVPPAGQPGRLVVATTGLTAQIAHDVAPVPADIERSPRADCITVIPATLDANTLSVASTSDGITSLPLGVDFTSGEELVVQLPDDEHLLVVGGARSGRSSTLLQLANVWQQAHPDGCIAAIVPRRGSPVTAQLMAADTAVLDDLPVNGPLLLIVDDAEMVDDPAGRLAALAAGGRPSTCIIVAGRPDALRQLYGHWTTAVRRSRCGVVLTGGSELDGDLLGVVLPRRTPVPPRPGLAWTITHGQVALTQIAMAQYGFAHGRTS
jgi:S-DNA-T family DNA segregation ATPase FtsK/SpoIIIE